MKLVIKGEFEALKEYKVIQGIYTALPSALQLLAKEPFKENKRELSFKGTPGVLPGHALKVIENSSTQTITIILK